MACQCSKEILSCLRKSLLRRGKCERQAFTFRKYKVQLCALLLLIFVPQFLKSRPIIAHPPLQFPGRECMELVMQPPINGDYALCFKAMLVDILRKRIDFRRPSWAVVRARSQTRKVSPNVVKIYDKNTNCR